MSEMFSCVVLSADDSPKTKNHDKNLPDDLYQTNETSPD